MKGREIDEYYAEERPILSNAEIARARPEEQSKASTRFVMKRKIDHSGSSFDSFLEEEGIREEVEVTAMKRVIAWQFEEAMKAQQKTKAALARDMHTSRTQLDRLLDPANTAVSLGTIARTADALGKRITISLSDNKPRIRQARSVLGKKATVSLSGRKERRRGKLAVHA